MQLRMRKYRHHSKRGLSSEDDDEHEVERRNILSGQKPRQKTSRKIMISLESDEDVE